MTFEHYQRLVVFLVARDKRMREILSTGQAEIQENLPYGCSSADHGLYSSTIASSLRDALEKNPCVQVIEALGIVSSAPLRFSPCSVGCTYDVRGLRGHAEGLLKELVEMAESLPWVDRYATTSLGFCFWESFGTLDIYLLTRSRCPPLTS